MQKWWISITALFISGILLNCSRTQKVIESPASHTHKVSKYYTTAYPHQDIGNQLANAQQSILRIISTSFYNSYTFDEPFLTLSDIRTNDPQELASSHFGTEESTAGTSILLEHNRYGALLISCEHVVTSPDTVIAYYEGEDIPEDTFIKSISIKRKQNNLLFTGQNLYKFDVIASSRNYDLALISARFKNDPRHSFRPLKLTTGKSDDLQLGSVLYVLGYPRGFPMVTRGLASTGSKRSSHYFITDALFNPGVSGGLVLATKDNYNSFQWVGMARSATATKENVLVPQPARVKYDQVAKPYSDLPFVQRKTRISYGITQTIPIDTIKEFIKKHDRIISSNGFRYSIE